jgi:hypothetical protein
MSQFSRVVFGAIAISLTFGAIQFAPAHDLTGITPGAGADREAVINRAAKADRSAAVAGSAEQTRTIALRLDGLSNTSVLIRMPLAKEARNRPSAPSLKKSGDRKMAVACEPPVSVLSEVAKLLQPGRCVT